MGFLGDLLKGVAGGIPIAGPLISGLFSGLQGQAANSAEKADREAWNKYLQDYGGAQQNVMSGLAGAGQDPFKGLTSSSTGSSFGSSTSNALTRLQEQIRKIVDPAQAGGKRALEQQVFGRLGTPAVTEGEMMRKLAETNKVYDTLGRKQEVLGAGMGPVRRLGMEQGLDADRGARLLDTLAARPELERARQFENENAANQLLNAWQGQNRDSTSRTSGTTNTTGSTFGTQQNAPDLQGLFSMFAPPAPQASMNTGFNPWLSAGADTWGALMQQMQQGKNGQSPMTMPAPGSAPLMVPYGR